MNGLKQEFLIAGGTGMIGSALSRRLISEGHQVSFLSRKAGERNGIRAYAWNPADGSMDLTALRPEQIIINLAGSSIAGGRWTSSAKKEIIRSRVNASNTLITGLTESGCRPHMILQASAIGYYGDRTGETLDESSAPGQKGFLAESVKIWEESAQKLKELTDHFSILRIGLVLCQQGGMWPTMSASSAVGVLNWIGTGKQIYSWIHLDDLIAAICFLTQKETVSPVYNLTAPMPVSMKEMIQQAAHLYSLPKLAFGIPEFPVRAVLGEMADLTTTSSLVMPQNLIQEGFVFQYPDIKSALENILK
jgi:uncharacterized protein (TIGR01777 family)